MPFFKGLVSCSSKKLKHIKNAIRSRFIPSQYYSIRIKYPTSKMSNLSNRKIAVVTGASQGIGYHVSRELAQHNYKVYACARHTEAIEKLAENFAEGVIIPCHLDISKVVEIKKFKEKLGLELPGQRLDLLFNNAGQSCTVPAIDVTDAMVEQCFQVNVFGHINMCAQLAEFLINAKGTITFTGSLAGIAAFPFGSIYGATKAAIHQYARVLHLEMRPFGVRVINTITGGVATDIAEKRPLPDHSYLNFKEGIEAFDRRREMAKRNHPTPVEEYAKQVVGDILSSRDPLDVYRGKLARLLTLVYTFLPYWLIEWGVEKKFRLHAAYKVLREKQH